MKNCLSFYGLMMLLGIGNNASAGSIEQALYKSAEFQRLGWFGFGKKDPPAETKKYRDFFELFTSESRPPELVLKGKDNNYLELSKLAGEVGIFQRWQLEKMFGTDYNLWLCLVADTDQDQTPDWIWDPSSQRFLAQDEDIDGDGIVNLEDANPFEIDPIASDQDDDGIVDHLDWSPRSDELKVGISAAMAEWQSKIYAVSGVIAINRDTSHNIDSMEAFYQIVANAYGNVLLKNKGKFPGLKYFFAKKGNPKDYIYAYFRPMEESITILDFGRAQGENKIFGGYIPLSFYATIIHELGHTLQMYLGDEEVINRAMPLWENLSPEGREQWVYSGHTEKYWNKEISREANLISRKARRAQNPESIIAPVVDIFLTEQTGKVQLDWLQGQVASQNHILSYYSLTSPYEFFAESVAAYVFEVMIQKRFSHLEGETRIRAENEARIFIEGNGELQSSNIDPIIFSFLEKELELEKHLQFDRTLPNGHGARGLWVYR